MSELELRKLKQIWRKKLEQSGFSDIEDARDRIRDHKTLQDLYKICGFRSGSMESIRDYYFWATEKFHHGDFETDMDKTIWGLHSEGKSTREIERIIRLEQSTIAKYIRRIRHYLTLQSSESLY